MEFGAQLLRTNILQERQGRFKPRIGFCDLREWRRRSGTAIEKAGDGEVLAKRVANKRPEFSGAHVVAQSETSAGMGPETRVGGLYSIVILSIATMAQRVMLLSLVAQYGRCIAADTQERRFL